MDEADVQDVSTVATSPVKKVNSAPEEAPSSEPDPQYSDDLASTDGTVIPAASTVVAEPAVLTVAAGPWASDVAAKPAKKTDKT